ncbi:aspartate carbamoyltransferase regulatory subunit [Candidatus Bipolaricaulota bacterium]|nr:aspartate carbamoyltransferase regulatory subunit [Candidatus Bipolaricaulota bacterium]
MLRVNAINKGIVLDHIQAGNGIRIFERLRLKGADYPVALLMNVESTKMGRKDIIKISDTLDLDLTMLGLLDPRISVNYIEESRVTSKVHPGLPERVDGLIACKNPRCITTDERHGPSSFTLLDKETKVYKCSYCGERVRM